MADVFRGVRGLAAVVLLLAPAIASAQEASSQALAGELVKLLDARQLDSVAAKAPEGEDVYVGALYFPGSQLLVVGARYTAPARMQSLLAEKNYRDIYIDLNSASVPESKVFVSDLGANGLKARRDDGEPFDTVDLRGKSFAFDGDWDGSELSETEAFQVSEREYVRMLEALVAELKKSS